MSKAKTEEMVVLVDENDRAVGSMLKTGVHHKETPLHRGFSIYLFERTQGQVLIQRRNAKKLTWGGFWSNSCCGHPGPGESYEDAGVRRVAHELGAKPQEVQRVADYRYRFEHNGIVENEVCPILVGLVTREEVEPDPSEVEEFKWQRWSDYLSDMETHPELYSPWSKEQVKILSKSTGFRAWAAEYHIALE